MAVQHEPDLTARHPVADGGALAGAELLAVLAASRTGTWRWDAATGEVRWDPTLEALCGFEPGTFAGTFDAWLATLHPDEVSGILAVVDDAIERRGAYHFEHRTVWPDGQVRWLECRGQVTTDLEGTVTGTVGCAVDVTERKQAERDREALLDRERRLRDRIEFLSGLTATATEAGDHQELMRAVCRAAVPRLGDWCSIHFLPEPGAAVETVVVHSDPAKTAWAEALVRRYPYDPSAPRGVPRVIRTGEPEIIERVTDAVIDEAVARSRVDPAAARDVLDRAQLTSIITVPLRTKRGVLGAMQFVSAESRRVYDADDVRLAEVAGGRIAEVLDNMWLTDRHRHVSSTLQQALLPPALPTVPGVELAARYWPAGTGLEVGGDFYDLFERGTGGWSLVIGDVCGTGAEAAALTGIARHTIRAAARHGHDHLAVLGWLNEAVLHSDRDRFCTVAYVTLDNGSDGRWRLESASAGHPLPVLVRHGGVAGVVGSPGTLAGVFADPHHEPVATHLSVGDVVVLYTDGLSDLPPPLGLVPDQVVALVREAAAARSAEEIADHIHRDLRRRAAPGRCQDDTAIVVLRVTAPPARERRP